MFHGAGAKRHFEA